MICITSISPTHINADIQAKAVQSWIDCGMTVYSINSHKECQNLKDKYPNVAFIETKRTMEKTFGKPYVSINAVLDWCKDQKEEYCCIINSDIELKMDESMIENLKKEMDSGIVMANRVNYQSDYTGSQYLLGIDAFFIHQKWMPAYSQTIFCFGQCFWDYWIPYSAHQQGINLTFVKQNIAYHKEHNVQYKHEDWLRTGRYFLWEHNLWSYNSSMPQEIGRMSKWVYNYIYTNSTRKEI